MDLPRPASRRALLGAAATLPLVTLLRPAWAQDGATSAPAAQQVPGLWRAMIGEIEVLAISDGWFQLGLQILPQATEAEAAPLLERAFLTPATLRGAVNAFLVRTGGRTVLIDAGTGGAMGPTLGRLAEVITAAGTPPSSVEAILLTHLHPDHAGGLVTGEGTAAFPNAQLHMAEAEHATWIAGAASLPEAAKGMGEMATRMVQPYAGEATNRFSMTQELFPGITPVPLPGHTPGHTGFRIASGDQQLLIWGDVVHVPALQFARPDWTVTFDSDQDQARATRLRTFDMVATDRMLVAGAHLNFPGVGYVAKRGEGYEFVPVAWESEP